VVGPPTEQHRVLCGDHPAEVLLHDLVELGDELVRRLGNAIQRQQFVGDDFAHFGAPYRSDSRAAVRQTLS
jgi:hypothetical protein